MPRFLNLFSGNEVNIVTRKILNHYKGVENIHQLSVAEARQLFIKINRSSRKPRIEQEINIKFGSISGVLYIPRKIIRSDRLVVYFHGGGFVLGSAKSSNFICRLIADKWGMILLNVDYPLAPENKLQDQVKEIIKSLQEFWADNKLRRSLGVEKPQAIFMTGESAGANIAAQAAVKMDKITAGCVLYYPWVRLRIPKKPTGSLKRFESGYFISTETLRWFSDLSIGVNSKLNQPIDYKKLPPTFVIGSGCDPLRDDSRFLGKLLIRNSNVHRFREFGGMPHGFLAWPGIVSFSKQAICEGSLFLKNL